MKRAMVLFLLAILLPAFSLFAGGAQERVEYVNEAPIEKLPGDANSKDMILQKGLPKLSDDPVKVDYLTIWTSGKSADAEAVWLNDELSALYPNLEVEIERLSTNALKEAATVRVIAGTPPTMARISGGYAIDEFVKQGLLQDVTRYWEEYPIEDFVSSSLANSFKFNGRYYGFPFSDAPQGLLFWNKDVFEQYGIPEPPYESWDEFFLAAERWNEVRPGVPFYTYSLNPGWYGLERAFVQAATKFGKEYIYRIFNGEATEKDFKDLIEFNKELVAVSNKDYVSLEGTKGVQEVVIRGDAAICYSGSWGYAAFTAAGIDNVGFSLLPGHPMHFTTMSGLVIFANSGKEEAGEAIAMNAMLKDVQHDLNLLKDNLPARTDTVVSAEEGWSPVALYIEEQLQKGAEIIPRANTGFPSTVLSSMEPVFVSCMTDEISVEEGARKLYEIQEANSDKFNLIHWE